MRVNTLNIRYFEDLFHWIDTDKRVIADLDCLKKIKIKSFDVDLATLKAIISIDYVYTVVDAQMARECENISWEPDDQLAAGHPKIVHISV